MTEESKVESELKKFTESLGGICYKFVSPGRRNVPDRICVFPKGVVFFIECKGSKTLMRDGQIRELMRLKHLDQHVYILKGLRELEALKILIREEVDHAASNI